jgi:hypothetical protein
MADPVLTGGIRVLSILQGISGLPEDRFINTWAFSSDVASTEAAQLAAIAKVGNFFNDATGGDPSVESRLAGQSIDETACEFRAYYLGDPPDERVPLIVPWAGLTLSSAQALPSEVAICGSYYATLNKPKSRGRVYIGPLTATSLGGSSTTPGVPVVETLGAIRNACDVMASDTSGPRWCVLSQVDAQLKIVTAGWVDNAFDTVRKRGERADVRYSWAV